MTSEMVTGAVTLALGVVIAVAAHRIADPGMDSIGPGTFPFALGVIIAVCGVAIMLVALKRTPPKEREEPIRWHVVWTAFALLFAYSFALAYLGFLLATVVLVPALLILLGTRRAAMRIALSALVVSGAVFLIFGTLLGVDLPTGTFFGG